MKRFECAFLILWVYCWIGLSNGQLEIPLKRHTSALHKMMELGLHKHLKSYSIPDDTVPLFKFYDSEFFAEVGVGHPGQTMKLILDIAWRDSWMMSSFCPIYKPLCHAHNLYNSKLSSTYIPNGTVFHLDLDKNNSMTGFLSTDRIILGQLTADNITFAEITDIPIMYMFLKADGLLGFGIRQPNEQSTFIETLFKNQLISAPLFSIYINGDKTSDKGGSVMLGDVHKKNFNESTLIYLNTIDSTWNIPMSNFTMIFSKSKNKTFYPNGCNVQLNTGSNALVGPKKDVDQINMLLGARELYLDRFILDCGTVPKLPKFSFNFNGMSYLFKGQDLVQEVNIWKIGKMCLSVFMPHDNLQNQWYFGTAFMKKVYTIYDFGSRKVGLASANL